jgi:four helix bundle protein
VAENYKNLLVWKQGMALAKDCYLLTRTFPKEEMYGMTSQIRRAASSIPANIAEGSARGTAKDFASFLRIAQGSLRELETHLLLSAEVELTTGQNMEPLLTQINSISYLLVRLIAAQTGGDNAKER